MYQNHQPPYRNNRRVFIGVFKRVFDKKNALLRMGHRHAACTYDGDASNSKPCIHLAMMPLIDHLNLFSFLSSDRNYVEFYDVSIVVCIACEFLQEVERCDES